MKNSGLLLVAGLAVSVVTGCFMFHDNPDAPDVKPNDSINDMPIFRATNSVPTNAVSATPTPVGKR